MRVSVLRARVVAGLLAALTVAACSSGSGVDTSGGPPADASPAVPVNVPPSPGATPAPSGSPALPEQEAILAQYRAFFESLTPLSSTDSLARTEAMRKFATDPELTRVLGGMAASTAAGEVFYGTPVIRPKIVSVVGDTASLTDCQDTSANGRIKAATGKKVTVGQKNDLASITMQRGADGIWRLATATYAPAGSCVAGV